MDTKNNISPFGPEQDMLYMELALAQAQKAFDANEVPVGAVVVDESGEVIGQSYNQVECLSTQRAHAEMLALEQASTQLGDWRLDDYWVYVTLEPCSMCMHYMKLSRVKGIVFGADSPLFGYRLDKNIPISVYKRDTVRVVPGVGAEKSVNLLKQFFHKKRACSDKRNRKGETTLTRSQAGA